ncbi:MAG TPA: MBL fold metallo-hydrolase [Opitutaceae bacterium]|nr:MBL fold metallo-hydrolase [Opitutaceae bacterium]
MVIEHIPLEDELGDVLEKAMRAAHLSEQEVAMRSDVAREKIRDAIDYRYDLHPDELHRLAAALGINEVGLSALAQGRYPLPQIAGLPFCLYPLRTPHGIGVANAYIVADCALTSGLLFDTGSDFGLLRRVWPKNVTKLDAVFLTHDETEHIGGLRGALTEFGSVPVFRPDGANIESALSISEGARLTFGGFEVKTLSTPGHVEAHNCYLVNATRVPNAAPLLISGDMLFAGSVGAPYYCRDRLAESIRRVFSQLPENTVVAPGHGPLTTIGNERRFNPFVV